MRVFILRSFPFSRDGFTTLRADAGSETDIPDALVPGLAKEGYVRLAGEAKAVQRAPENKMLQGDHENKAPESLVGAQLDGGAGDATGPDETLATEPSSGGAEVRTGRFGRYYVYIDGKPASKGYPTEAECREAEGL